MKFTVVNHEQLKKLFRLEGGRLFWLIPSKNHPRLIGKEAGSPIPNHTGKIYWHVQIDGRKVKRSHIVYCLTHGSWPAEIVDHIDGNSMNDRPENVRAATPTQNAWNHKRRAKRSRLPMGVRTTARGSYAARIQVNKRVVYLGAFASPQEASAVYRAARLNHFGEFA